MTTPHAHTEARLQRALEVAELGTWSWDLDTGAGDIGVRGAAIVGLPPGDLADVASAQIASIHPGDLARIEADIAAGIASGHPINLDYRVVHPDGSIHHVASRAGIVRDEQGRPSQLVGTNRDVTAEWEAEAERVRLLAEAEEAMRARDTFLSIATHELRTPLTALKGTVQLRRRQRGQGPDDPARLDRALAVLDQSANRLATLLDDLTDVTRLGTDRFPLDARPYDLVALVDEAIATMRESVGAGHTLTLDITGAIPILTLDAIRIGQVLTNVLGNAVKYSPDGGTVAVVVRTEGDGVRVAVRDAGVGLPPEAAEAIFAPFGRAANATASRLPGMGLGLFICRGIVERHGGWIRAESAGEGQGTTVTFWLPLTSAGDPDRTDSAHMG